MFILKEKAMQSEQIDQLAAALAIAQGENNEELESDLLIAYAKKPAPTLLSEFMSRLIFGMSECWYWRGSITDIGYGSFSAAKKYGINEHKAHRVSWILFRGPIPKGMKILHSCDIRNCVNPDHLSVGTQADNVRDMIDRGRHRYVPMLGENNPMAKLTSEDVSRIRDMRAVSGTPFKAIAKYFDVSNMTAFRAATGKSWSH